MNRASELQELLDGLADSTIGQVIGGLVIVFVLALLFGGGRRR